MNTTISYVSSERFSKRVYTVFTGEITADQIQSILDSCEIVEEEEELDPEDLLYGEEPRAFITRYFIPQQVGLWYPYHEGDSPFCKDIQFELSDQPASNGVGTVDDLVAAFKAASGNWDPTIAVEPVEEEINTLFSYNYHRECYFAIFAGEITAEQVGKILRACKDEKYFVPEQVGLVCNRPSESETPFCELDVTPFEPIEEEPTVQMTLDELVSAFEKASGHWGVSSDDEAGNSDNAEPSVSFVKRCFRKVLALVKY